MAKLSLNKLNIPKEVEQYKSVEFNGVSIEILEYLPVAKKLSLVSDIVNMSYDEEDSFINKGRIEIYSTLYIIEAYTNIKFTEKQKNEVYKTYDTVYHSGLWDTITYNMSDDELDTINCWVHSTIESLKDHHDSIYGILESLQEDYENLSFDSQQIANNLQDPDNLKLLKGVMDKLG